MEIIIFTFLHCIPFWLFIRDCQLDRKRTLENERKSNLHVLSEMQQFHQRKGLAEQTNYSQAIDELKNQNFEITWRDYLSWKRY